MTWVPLCVCHTCSTHTLTHILQAEAKACQDKLSLAERLTTGLASENSRWAKEVETLRAQEVRLCFLLCVATHR